MNRIKIALALGSAWVSSACSQTAARVEPPPAEPAPTEGERAMAEWEAAIQEVEARCRKVQESSRLPVSCQLDVVDDTARMQLVMTNRAAAETYMSAAENELIIPFCELTRMVRQPAGIVVSLHQERVMRVGDCSTMEYSDWQSADPRVQQLTAASRACQAIQDSSLPIGCSMGELDRVPSLIVRYDSGRVSEDTLGELGRLVGAPFCSATSASGVAARVYLVEDDARAKGFDCTTGEDTGWISVRRSPPPSRPVRPRSHEGRRVAAASPLTDRTFVYEKLPMQR
jgi:hypothetical protein